MDIVDSMEIQRLWKIWRVRKVWGWRVWGYGKNGEYEQYGIWRV